MRVKFFWTRVLGKGLKRQPPKTDCLCLKVKTKITGGEIYKKKGGLN